MTTRINKYQKEVKELKDKREKAFDAGDDDAVEKYNKMLRVKSIELRKRIKSKID